jgi:hypothetical protein
MRNCRQTQVFCGTAEPFVMDLSMIDVSGSAVAWIHYQKRWSLPYLTLLFALGKNIYWIICADR